MQFHLLVMTTIAASFAATGSALPHTNVLPKIGTLRGAINNDAATFNGRALRNTENRGLIGDDSDSSISDSDSEAKEYRAYKSHKEHFGYQMP
ncbi:RxLR-like protein [Plasmopara halstedii]|uniref:Secreted RxLR effector protein RXLR-C02 n=1 Tax=Plasmopara halstedii TaxID=4781 RepID=RLR02_PLAHL|nr:RxLR-like protein [Plasmopara halstedii]A0A0P1A544.1 RecName: Full=Secreted RxLR effector protein RXLR-C02; Flags: Precursor [Plasmopara halstedii]CEG35256.1 RxLR-like protein [Plasmopara halstedii]|eukprot:XP_024571625.1 RxLR-like protein [Plasmopara halstedii]